MAEEEQVPFDIEEFFDQLIEKLERAKAKNLQPVIREKPSWVIAIPEDVVNERVTDLFTIMVKQENDALQLHYGNTTEPSPGDLYRSHQRGFHQERDGDHPTHIRRACNSQPITGTDGMPESNRKRES